MFGTPVKTPVPPDSSKRFGLMKVHCNGDVPLPCTKSPAAHVVIPVRPFATLLDGAGAVFVTMMLPVEPERLMPVLAVSDTTPVLVSVTAPVAAETPMPLPPVRDVTPPPPPPRVENCHALPV